MKLHLHIILFVINCGLTFQSSENVTPRIIGMSSSIGPHPNPGQLMVIHPNQQFDAMLYGIDMPSFIKVGFTLLNGTFGSECIDILFYHSLENISKWKSSFTGEVQVVLSQETILYLCAKTWKEKWVFQDIKVHYKQKSWMPPLWLKIILATVLFLLSGLCSGLNLGLMTLSPSELEVIVASGDEDEKRYAKAILPLRRHGNWLLCTILLCNVAANSTLTILMDDLTGNGMSAAFVSTAGIVIFGEIIPQSFSSRYSLAIGANTIWITYVMLFIFSPVAFPFSLILDYLLGKEMGMVYNREKMANLIQQQASLGAVKKHEADIITGALQLTTKTVHDIMTPLKDIFMIPSSTILNFTTISDLVKSGFSRIPVYSDDRHNIVALLHIKDLTFVDPDDNTPLQTVIQFYRRSIVRVDEYVTLETILDDFRKGKTHMAFVQQNDPDHNEIVVGLVTLEDVIEEILQLEINDETDVFTDNVRKVRRSSVKNVDFSAFKDNATHCRITPQLKVATLRHITSNIEMFGPDYITIPVIQSLLNSGNVIGYTHGPLNKDAVLYEFNKSYDFAIMLIQGFALVEVGVEKLKFEAGPFVIFGESIFKAVNDFLVSKGAFTNAHTTPAAIQQKLCVKKTGVFKSDYKVTALTDLQYVRITSTNYANMRFMSHSTGVSTSMEHSAPLSHEPIVISQKIKPVFKWAKKLN